MFSYNYYLNITMIKTALAFIFQEKPDVKKIDAADNEKQAEAAVDLAHENDRPLAKSAPVAIHESTSELQKAIEIIEQDNENEQLQQNIQLAKPTSDGKLSLIS